MCAVLRLTSAVDGASTAGSFTGITVIRAPHGANVDSLGVPSKGSCGGSRCGSHDERVRRRPRLGTRGGAVTIEPNDRQLLAYVYGIARSATATTNNPFDGNQDRRQLVLIREVLAPLFEPRIELKVEP